MKKISSTNTKAQILEAYEEALKVLQEERNQNVALKRDLEKQKSIVEQVKSVSSTGQNIKLLKETFNTQLDQIEDALMEEQLKFKELQEAICIEQKHLEELYKIKAEADSLDALVFTHKQAKDNLEKEIYLKKEILTEEIEAAKKEWEKEKEAYLYNLKIKRRNEEDAYQQEKLKLEKELKEKQTLFEKEITEREQKVAENETSFKQLRKEAEQFEKQLEKVKSETEADISKKVTKELEYKYNIQTKDLEAELKLAKQEIDILKTKIIDQNSLIEALQEKLDTAGLQVKDIALKAIENAGIKSITLPVERKKESE